MKKRGKKKVKKAGKKKSSKKTQKKNPAKKSFKAKIKEFKRKTEKALRDNPSVAGIILIALVALAVLAYSFIYVYRYSVRTDASLSELRSGNLDTGLELCHKVKLVQYSDICYINYAGMMINSGEEFDKSLCDMISDNRPREKEIIGCYE